MVNGVKVTMLSCDECGARFRSTERNADKYVYLESMGRNPRGLSLTVGELQKRDKPVQWLEVANITSGAVRECGN
jgi:hypothetical protein